MKHVANFRWRNHHWTADVAVQRLYNISNRTADGGRPANLLERWKAGIARIQEMLGEAETEQAQVRALGGGWSLSQAAVTTGFLVATQSLDIIDIGLYSDDIIHPTLLPQNMALMQCGASVEAVNREAALQGLCLPTTGASDGQTIVGAISTGTHGSAHKVGGMQECVRGLHLITASNAHYWIEGAAKVVSDSFVTDLFPGAGRINDDGVFNAAIVSFGSFGVIHAIVLECEPMYRLEVWQNQYPWKELKPYLTNPASITPYLVQKTGANLDESLLHHVQMILNPYVADDDDMVTLQAMFKRQGAAPKRLRTAPTFDSAELYDLIAVLTGALDSIGALPATMCLLNGGVTSKYPPLKGQAFSPRDFFTGGRLAVSAAGLSIEIGVDVANAEKTMNLVLATAKAIPFPGIVGIRYVKQSAATLAFTSFPLTACFEIVSPQCNPTINYYNAILAALESEDIPFTLHWGQWNDYDLNGAAKVRKRWGDAAVNSWIEARNRVLNAPALRNRFSNPMIENCGLNAAPPNIVVADGSV